MMGLNKLGEIMEIYREAGKDRFPVAVIINGSLPNEQFITGTVEDIEAKINKTNIQGPVLIVVGEAVKLHLDKKERAAGLNTEIREIVQQLHITEV